MPSIRKAVPLGVPFRLILVSKIPRNAMGKVDRRRLIEQIRRNAQSSQQRQPERKPEHA
jgi:acyl-CoA synthetase (AMP-forming)/AMP-acid ligase II